MPHSVWVENYHIFVTEEIHEAAQLTSLEKDLRKQTFRFGTFINEVTKSKEKQSNWFTIRNFRFDWFSNLFTAFIFVQYTILSCDIYNLKLSWLWKLLIESQQIVAKHFKTILVRTKINYGLFSKNFFSKRKFLYQFIRWSPKLDCLYINGTAQ